MNNQSKINLIADMLEFNPAEMIIDYEPGVIMHHFYIDGIALYSEEEISQPQGGEFNTNGKYKLFKTKENIVFIKAETYRNTKVELAYCSIKIIKSMLELK